jgi:hypothetical protein
MIYQVVLHRDDFIHGNFEVRKAHGRTWKNHLGAELSWHLFFGVHFFVCSGFLAFSLFFQQFSSIFQLFSLVFQRCSSIFQTPEGKGMKKTHLKMKKLKPMEK